MFKKIIKTASILLIFTAIGIYAYFHFRKEEPQIITLQKNIDLPIDKVFPHFDHLQKLNNWSVFFSEKDFPSMVYYSPYEGLNASSTLFSKDKKRQIELSIKKRKAHQHIQYQIIESNNKKPILLDVHFKPVGNGTQLNYKMTIPPTNAIFQDELFDNESDFQQKVNQSMAQLKNFVENKIQKENQLGKIQFDSIEVEKLEATNYIGISSSSKNNKNDWTKNLEKNSTKLENFITLDMGIKADDMGYTTLFYAPKSTMKEQQYFLGISVNQLQPIKDASFSVQHKPASHALIAYYKGDWEGRVKVQQNLLQKADKENKTMHYFALVFLKKPQKDQPILVKMILAYS